MGFSARQRFIGKGDIVPMEDIGFCHRECIRQGLIRHRDRLKFHLVSLNVAQGVLSVKEYQGLVHEGASNVKGIVKEPVRHMPRGWSLLKMS
jgi:hypothetical protein